MSPLVKVIAAFVIGGLFILFKLGSGQSAPTATTYTGATFYWLSYAFGIPAILAGLAWVFRRKDPHCKSFVAGTFLIATAVIGAVQVLGYLLR